MSLILPQITEASQLYNYAAPILAKYTNSLPDLRDNENPLDLTVALHYLREAAAKGHSPAICTVARWHSTLLGEDYLEVDAKLKQLYKMIVIARAVRSADKQEYQKLRNTYPDLHSQQDRNMPIPDPGIIYQWIPSQDLITRGNSFLEHGDRNGAISLLTLTSDDFTIDDHFERIHPLALCDAFVAALEQLRLAEQKDCAKLSDRIIDFHLLQPIHPRAEVLVQTFESLKKQEETSAIVNTILPSIHCTDAAEINVIENTARQDWVTWIIDSIKKHFPDFRFFPSYKTIDSSPHLA